MKTRRLVLHAAVAFSLLADLPATPAGFDDAAPAASPAPAYERRDLEGWTVPVRRELIQTNLMATEHALQLLRKQLEEIVRVVPAPAVKELRLVPLYFSPEYPGRQPTAKARRARGRAGGPADHLRWGRSRSSPTRAWGRVGAMGASPPRGGSGELRNPIMTLPGCQALFPTGLGLFCASSRVASAGAHGQQVIAVTCLPAFDSPLKIG